MTKVTVTSWVNVKDGPNLSTSIDLEPESVTQAVITLDAAGASPTEKTAELVAAGGSVALLALSAVDADKKPATITVTPKNGGTTGSGLSVTGALLIANSAVLAALVADGPRALVLKNAGTKAVTVQIIAARSD